MKDAINGTIVSFNNPRQIINMGGPWIGELFFDGNKIMDDVVVDNVYLKKKQNKLFFLKYNLVSKWQKDNFFSVCHLLLNSKEIFIQEITDDGIFIYFDSFHDKDESKKKYLKL